MIKKIIIGLCLIGSFFIWSGCGGNYEAPVGSTISMPDSVSITETPTNETTNTEFFNISVKNQSGVPLKDVQLWITYPVAIPSALGYVQLYDGDTAQDSPMTVKTDENGVYILKIVYRLGGGLVYSGDISVSSGSVNGSTTFSVGSTSTTTEG